MNNVLKLSDFKDRTVPVDDKTLIAWLNDLSDYMQRGEVGDFAVMAINMAANRIAELSRP